MEKVPAPFGEALGRAHTALLKDLLELEEAGRPASRSSLPVLRSRLEATSVHIMEHFRFEEQNGYMETIRQREPRLGRAIDELAKEHGQLLKSLDIVLEETFTAPCIDETIGAKISEWINQVRQHEARENQLVQDAFNLDIGPED